LEILRHPNVHTTWKFDGVSSLFLAADDGDVLGLIQESEQIVSDLRR
jgi:hypothetical protein